MRQHRFGRLGSVALAVSLVVDAGACGGLSVHTEVEPAHRFSTGLTFAWNESTMPGPA